jgi:predicted phosphodiesterase
MADTNGRGIGLIADSHGNLEATAEAIHLLKGRDAGIIVHLGDFCDSVRRDRTGAMIRLLRENSVLAVKGNNDFFIESALTDLHRLPNPEAGPAIDFLQTLPLSRALNGLLFAHSLPFDTLRSFYEPIDTGNTQRAERLFAEMDFRLLFCGHSHLPVIFRKAGSRVTREHMPPGQKLVLSTEGEPPHMKTNGGPPDRFIVIVGAADDGECAFYDREGGIYERIRIFTSQ